MSVKCKPILLHRELHERGERVDVEPATVRWLAWYVASELIRRHPGRLRVVESHPVSIYDCVSLLDLSEPVTPSSFLIHLNLEGHITPLTAGQPAGNLDNRFNWYEVLKSPNRRDYVVKQLEGAVGLRRLNTTPKTSARSVGPRCLARVAELAAATAEGWTIRAGFGFDSDGSLFRRELFDYFPDIPTWEFRATDVPEASRFWFIVDPGGTPAAAIDTGRGIAWRLDGGSSLPLLRIYRSELNSIDRVVGHLVPIEQLGVRLDDRTDDDQDGLGHRGRRIR